MTASMRPLPLSLLLLAGMLNACTPPSSSLPVPVSCAPAQAQYQHRSAPGFTMRFVQFAGQHGANAPYYLELATPRQQRYWFRFASSNGYGGLSLIPVQSPLTADPESGPQDMQNIDSDALSLLRVYPLDADLAILDDPFPAPHAPAHLLAPEIGQLLWYEPGLLNGMANTPPETLPRGLFTLARCATSS